MLPKVVDYLERISYLMGDPKGPSDLLGFYYVQITGFSEQKASFVGKVTNIVSPA